MDDRTEEARRRRGGRGMEVQHGEKVSIAMMAAAGDSKRAIARNTWRSRECIARVLKSEEVEALRVQARNILDRAAPRLAENLITASTVGASKGRFEGSFNALRALDVIRVTDEDQGPRVVVNVGVVSGWAGELRPAIAWRNDDGSWPTTEPTDD